MFDSPCSLTAIGIPTNPRVQTAAMHPRCARERNRGIPDAIGRMRSPGIGNVKGRPQKETRVQVWETCGVQTGVAELEG